VDSIEKGEEKDIDEWDELTRLSYEREVLGFYISGHPLQPFRWILRALGIKGTGELKILMDEDRKGLYHKSTLTSLQEEGENSETDLLNGTSSLIYATPNIKSSIPEVSIAGLVVELKKHRTKGKNEVMAFLTIEDEDGAVEVLVFPELYKRSMDILEKASTLIIRGKADMSEKGIKIIAEEITDIELFIRKALSSCSRIQLKVRYPEMDRAGLLSLKDMLMDGPSSLEEPVTASIKSFSPLSIRSSFEDKFIPLYIQLKMSDCIITIKSRYNLRPDFNLFKKIQDIFGKNSLEVIR
jgi:DNA polymerase-3 subunit alpha